MACLTAPQSHARNPLSQGSDSPGTMLAYLTVPPLRVLSSSLQESARVQAKLRLPESDFLYAGKLGVV